MDRRDFTRAHNEYLDYDRWAGNQEGEAIDLTDKLEGMGKSGHGLCGKDADLDYGGQIVVESCYWLEDDQVVALVTPYATICEPLQKDGESDFDYDIRRSEYGEVVCNWEPQFPGEWTGDDWIFHMTQHRSTHPYGVHGFEVRTKVEWDDSLSDEANEEKAVHEIYNAIFEDVCIREFQESMRGLSKAGEN